MSNKKILLTGIMVIFALSLFSQQFGPKPIKSFDNKLLKNKMLLIPEYEQMAGLIKEDAFSAFETDKKVDAEYQRRWDEAIKLSDWDLTDYKITRVMRDKLKKEKDKTALILYFESDFYKNLYANLVVTEPKYKMIAQVPVNGFDFSNIDDLRLMMNMLTFAVVKSGKFNDPEFKELYKNHVFIYRNNVKRFSDGIKKKVFMVPMYSKERQNFEKINEKINTYLKEEWKLSEFDFVSTSELENRKGSENFDGYYLKSIPIYTSNAMMPYNYFVLLTPGQTVLHCQMGEKELNAGTLKLIQFYLQKWLDSFAGSQINTKTDTRPGTKTAPSKVNEEGNPPSNNQESNPQQKQKPKKVK